jgi:hypothetical protein
MHKQHNKPAAATLLLTTQIKAETGLPTRHRADSAYVQDRISNTPRTRDDVNTKYLSCAGRKGSKHILHSD